MTYFQHDLVELFVNFKSSNPSIKNANPSFSYPIDIKANLSTDRKEVCPKMWGKPRKTQERGFKPKMKIPPAVQMTAGGMLIFLVVSKKRRHVKQQTPDAVFLHHIFKIGLRSGRSASSGPFLCPAAENAGVFLRFFTIGKTRTEAPFSVLNL